MWWLSLIKLLGGLDIGGLANTAAKAYADKQDAGVKRDQIDSDLVAKSVALSIQEAQLNEQIIIAEQGNWLTRLARPAIAMPFVVYLWKIIIWDKVLGLGSTDDLSPGLHVIMGTVISSYFIGRTVEKTVSVLKGRTT